MRKSKSIIWRGFICIFMLLVAYQNGEAQQPLAQKVYAIFEQHCLNCHGEFGAYADELTMQHAELIASQNVIPRDTDASLLYQRLITENPAERMPLNLPRLSDDDIFLIQLWIAAGAPDWQTTATHGGFITTEEMFNTIEKHVNSLAPFDRGFARYFTLTHLYNAGESAEALHAYQRALSKLVNSLSWGREVINPQSIDAEATIFYIDLRDYEWEIGSNRWTQIESAYPYKNNYAAPTQTHLQETLARLREAMQCEVPFIHVDWFLANASLPPLYHDILALPATDRELEARLEVNVVENLRNAAGRRVWRAGFNDSGVSNHNRVVERHLSRYGAYWKSYDFAGSAGTQNIFTHPLSFRHDGGEIIFNLPNGLQAYYLVDAGGNRLDEAPISIVSNPAASDPTVRNGLSCIGCHTKGMKPLEDEVRAVVWENANPPFNRAQALRLYTEKGVMDELVAEDTARYRAALKDTGGVFGGIEPIQRFHEAFQAPLDAAHAAAAVGLETDAFVGKIRENASLQNLLGSLLGENGTVKRDTWTVHFSEVMFALDFPVESVAVPVATQTERLPGATVHIPDANLRAVIEEAIGKAPGTPITVKEMATIVDIGVREVRELTGIEFATNLERLFIDVGSEDDLGFISDLSPLAGLTKLHRLTFSSKSISDLSPLAGLINLEFLRFGDTDVSDLSPLAGLSKLKSIWFTHSPVSDLSPLAGLTNLERLRFFYAESPSLAPLKGLVGLKELSAARSGISDISPLVGLIHLEELELFENHDISDISPLASMRKLRRLHLQSNHISDVSPLASLHNLQWVHLGHNDISDISHLNRLPADANIIWYRNPGFPQGGPKIVGPWLWAMVPGPELNRETDFLSQASGGAVTELQIATRGAKEGATVADSVWTIHEISPTGGNNIGDMTNALGWGTGEETVGYVLYGSILLNSPREQQTKIFVGADDGVKVWLNGQLIYKEFGPGWDPSAINYQHIIPVTLNEGTNMLLVAVDNIWGDWSGFFGFAPEAEYAVVYPGTGFVLSTDTTSVRVGDTFTVRIGAEKVTDLAGWQFDVAFSPEILEAVEVSEGDLLKKGGGTTFFQRGTIDNTTGKIAGLSAALLSEKGVSGTGRLLSVVFSARGAGDSELTLSSFQLGDSTGEVIAAGVPNLTITVESKPTWDVNADGQVSVLDMIQVARYLGEDAAANPQADVNRDGKINVQDLILVAQHMGESTTAAAPFAGVRDRVELTPEIVRAWITQAQAENDGSLAFQQGIANLQSLFASLLPEETVLLANYPNPFNPETWIPYQLSDAADVSLTVYSARGLVVRQLSLGHKAAGLYESRSRAVYWDGKNEQGEPVASGVYFYTLTAGDFTATRKMLLRK